ncbi:MAG: methyltransferase domain-containing protein [Planctomycetota bacterium]|nr:MAG: methyltransferase domain-containing protein [Planctomycetota bacterium]
MNLAPVDSALPRVLEPEVMDSAAEARDYDAMDHGEVNRRFAADFLAALSTAGLGPEVEVLDLGTGTAQIPIELCRQDGSVRVVAIDLADEMLQLAAANVERAGYSERIRLQAVDAKRLPFDDGCFAAVMSNSIVHHIPEPRGALTEAVRVARPGGLLFLRDLSRPADDAQVARLVETYAGDCNAQQRKLFDDSLRAALTVGEIRALAAELGFDPGTVAPTSDRHWTWSAVARSRKGS